MVKMGKMKGQIKKSHDHQRGQGRKSVRKSGKESNPLKSKKTHIIWKRSCLIKQEFKVVRADNGGGGRLIECPLL